MTTTTNSQISKEQKAYTKNYNSAWTTRCLQGKMSKKKQDLGHHKRNI